MAKITWISCAARRPRARRRVAGLAVGLTALTMSWLLIIAPVCTTAADWSDPLDTSQAISGSAAKNGHDFEAGCVIEKPLPRPLRLMDAVDRIVCTSPRTREAWANLKSQAAQLGIARSAYLPTVSVQGSYGRADKVTTIPQFGQFDSTLEVNTSDVNVNLTWMLYDFGLRAANLSAARQLLNAAVATQDDVFQSTFLDAAQAFYDAQAARASLDAAQSAQVAADQSYRVSDGLYAASVGSLADRLQAKTALEQAKSRTVQASGDLQTALGTLAILMGVQPDQEIVVDAPSSDEAQSPVFTEAIGALMDEARRRHPKVLAAQAELEAARTNVTATKAQGRPSIELMATGDRSATPIAEANTAQNVRTTSIGIEVSIPLFEGLSRHYKIRQAQSQAEEKEAELSDAQWRVALNVWKSYQDLTTGSDNLAATQSLVQSATQSVDVSLGRYRAGVGTILELLKAQSDLAGAEQQRVSALLKFQKARLSFANSLGELGHQ
jgi:outer membrane protein